MRDPQRTSAAVIGDARASIALIANGEVGLGHPARCDFKVRHLAGSREIELLNVVEFCGALSDLHGSLQGVANLRACDDEFRIAVRPKGSLGHCRADVLIAEQLDEPIEYRLTFTFDFDQSHLPGFIAGLKSQFGIRGVQ